MKFANSNVYLNQTKTMKVSAIFQIQKKFNIIFAIIYEI